MTARDELRELAMCGDDRTADDKLNAYRDEVRREAFAEASTLIEATRAADERAHPDDVAHINRRIGMREAMTVLRREYEPAPEPSRRPKVRRPAGRFPSFDASGGESR